MTRLVTAYAMRRAVCGYKPAAPPPVFAKAPSVIDPDRYVESVRAHFLSQPDGHAFPSDDAFRAELTTRNMYRFRHRDAVLERLENHGRKETVPLGSCTVDHIMPQGERLGQRADPWSEAVVGNRAPGAHTVVGPAGHPEWKRSRGKDLVRIRSRA